MPAGSLPPFKGSFSSTIIYNIYRHVRMTSLTSLSLRPARLDGSGFSERQVSYQKQLCNFCAHSSLGHVTYALQFNPSYREGRTRAKLSALVDVRIPASRKLDRTEGRRKNVAPYSSHAGKPLTDSCQNNSRLLRLDELTDHLAGSGSSFELIGPDFDLAALTDKPLVPEGKRESKRAYDPGRKDHEGAVEIGGRSGSARYGRENVIQYLSTLGVDVELLEDILLPDDVTIMEERARFLRNIGLDVGDIMNQYPPLVGCSVRKNFLPILQFLESIPISRADIPDLLRKYPRILNSSVKIDLEPLIDYLLGFGIQRNKLGGMLVQYPEVLGFRLEGTMSTSVAYLVALGIEPRSMANILVQLPELLGMRVGNNLMPKIDFYLGLGIQSKDLPRLFAKYPFLLGYNLKADMRTAVEALESIGIKREQIGGLIFKFPQLLGLNMNELVDPAASWLHDRINIRKEDFAKTVLQSPHVLILDWDVGDRIINSLLDSGFELPDAQKLLRTFPQLLRPSLDSLFGPRLEYLMGGMGRSVEDILDYPPSLACSVEKLRSRYERVRFWGTKCTLSWMLEGNDASFAEKVKEYEESV